VIELSHVSVVYRKGEENEKCALKNATLRVAEGDFVIIVGPNGAGKSTLMKVLLCELAPTIGTYTLNGRAMRGFSVTQVARWVGRVFQDPNSGIFPDLSILENLSIASKKGIRGLRFRSCPQKAVTLLSRLGLGLENTLNVRAGDLSGGQKQALAMVMAIISDPKVLLLDEHTASLDPKSSVKVMELTRQINEQFGITVVMITHNMPFAEQYGNRKWRIEEGEVFEYEYRPPLRRTHLETPVVLLRDQPHYEPKLV
jgi:putative ABC transport system ATP-binding protein